VTPEFSNFFASLHTALSCRRIAGLFTPPTWTLRKCGWTDYEVSSPVAELVIESKSNTLMHGSVADAESSADLIFSILRAAGIGYTAECYDAGGERLREWKWEAT